MIPVTLMMVVVCMSIVTLFGLRQAVVCGGFAIFLRARNSQVDGGQCCPNKLVHPQYGSRGCCHQSVPGKMPPKLGELLNHFVLCMGWVSFALGGDTGLMC